MNTRKKVGIQLPKQAQNQTVETRYALELEALAPIADIVEIRADTAADTQSSAARHGPDAWPVRLRQRGPLHGAAREGLRPERDRVRPVRE